MATLAGVYSVNRNRRTAEDVLAALSRNRRDSSQQPTHPRTCHKRLVAPFAKSYDDDEEHVEVTGLYEVMSWAAGKVRRRR